MGAVTILNETTKNPITLIGERAGICWGADITDNEKNYKRGMDCIKSQHCFDGETEILTEQGFIKFSEYNGEKVYSVTAQLDFNNPEYPLEIIKNKFNGYVYDYSNSLGIVVTDGHRMFGNLVNSNKDLGTDNYKIFVANSKSPSRSSYNTNGERRFIVPTNCKLHINRNSTDYYYGKMIGFWLGDGVVGTKSHLKFHLKKERKINYLKNICEKLGLIFEKHPSNFYCVINKQNINYGTEIENQYLKNGIKFIEGFNHDNLSFYYGVYDGLVNSDGSKKRTGISIYNKSDYIIDWLLNYGCLMGLNVSEHITNPNGTRCVWIKNTNKFQVNDCEKPKDKVIIKNVENMPVYCVSVPSGLIIIRGKNGQTSICGNCRTLEYVNVEMILDGYSARVIREWYTHLGGTPTRLQASTRYIDYTKDNGFSYIIPHSIQNNKAALIRYNSLMKRINEDCAALEKDFHIPREDSAMCLPLAMTTKVVDKRNLRNLVDMSHQRLCSRAFWEFRELFTNISDVLSEISEEWRWIVKNLFVPKCEYLGYCNEKRSCGRVEQRESL